jgi:hypothetical protein
MCIRIPLVTVWLLGVSLLFGGDERQLALTLRAQFDFDRVESAVHPELQQINGCVQSQAAAIAVAGRSELASLFFRKGYCALVGATLTHSSGDFLEAAVDFDKSIGAWPDVIGRNATVGRDAKGVTPQPVSSGLRVLATVSRLEADPAKSASRAQKQELEGAVDTSCPSVAMSPSLCQSLVGVGRQWLGWIALQQNDSSEAAREFAYQPGSPWALWTAGRKAFHDRNYPEASAHYGQAIQLWTRAQQEPGGLLAARLDPRPEMPNFLMQLGGTQILAGEPAAAIPPLDRAIKADPTLARAIYYRARAEELSGREEAALADFSLASRTAFANARDLASGEAHLYRGIQFYRRKDYAHAEDEFASALNFDMLPELRPDAQAWRYMAAVAGGACGASRQLLEDSLAYSSPFFPKQEARAVAASCPWPGAGGAVSGAFLTRQ